MHYFIHVITDNERIIDPEGASFPDLEEAKNEASQSARDLMAEELRCGRPVPLDWRVQIADEFGVVVNTIKFATLLFGDHRRPERQPGNRMLDAMLMERAKATFARVRRSHSEINDGLLRLKAQVRALADFNAALRGGPSDIAG